MTVSDWVFKITLFIDKLCKLNNRKRGVTRDYSMKPYASTLSFFVIKGLILVTNSAVKKI